MTIVIFSSFGIPPAPAPRGEFVRFFLSQSPVFATPRFNIITVADDARKYFLDGRTEILASVLNAFIAESGSLRTVTLGSSMGGFGAVALARRLSGCDQVIAFGAHSSIHPKVVPFDQRRRLYWDAIGHWDVVDCTDEISEFIHYDLIYGGLDSIDCAHAERYGMAGKKSVDVSFVEQSDHNVAAFWEALGVLRGQLLRRVNGIRSDAQSKAPGVLDWSENCAAKALLTQQGRRDVNLHLMVNGKRILPIGDSTTALFIFSADAQDVRLVSSTFVPALLTGATDTRRLGISISGMCFSASEGEPRRVNLDDPAIVGAFHEEERREAKTWRWTRTEATHLASELWADMTGKVALHLFYSSL